MPKPTKLRDGSEVADKRLARLVLFDKRSRKFPIRKTITAKKPRSFTWSCGKHLNQGVEGACVGFSCTHELIARPASVSGLAEKFAREQIYWEAQKIDPWEGGCVDEETTCLTMRGWLGPEALNPGDEILGFDMSLGQTRWATVERVHRYHMPYRIWSKRGIALAVTDDHKWVVRSRVDGGPYSLVQTTELKSQHQFPRSVPCADLPVDPTVSNDFVELIGWVMTEGYYRHDSRHGTAVEIYQKTYEEDVAALMDRLRVTSTWVDKRTGCRTWSITGNLAHQIREAAPERAPSLCWLRSLTLEQLDLLIEISVHGDGSEELPCDNRQGRQTFLQKEGIILDSWLAACVLAGRPISRKGNKMGSKKNVDNWSLRISSGFVDVRGMEMSPYLVGDVWCPQSTLGTFVARRANSIFITGNSYPGAKPRYEGTAVLAGMKILQQLGYIKEYRWAFGLDDLVMAVGYKGPVVLGLNWYESMFEPHACGYLHVSGDVAGGHVILCKAVNVPERYFVLHNSWGSEWGRGGDARISWEEMDRLLHEDGEAVVPVGRRSRV